MIKRLTAIALVCASTAAAQVGNYLGPGILSRGAGATGTRGGQDVSIRFGGQVSGFYDTGLTPLTLDSSGKIPDLGGDSGIEAGLFAYGVKRFRRAQLGLDYQGNFRHYTTRSNLDGSDHMLALGYTWQTSRRLVLDFRQTAGTTSRGNSGFAGVAYNNQNDVFNPNTALLFDSRAYYSQSGMDVTYLVSPRTAVTAGGEGFLVRRTNKALIGLNGYMLQGEIQHRLSAVSTLGVTYNHVHYDFPTAFGEADIDSYQGVWARALGRYWTVRAQGGVYHVEAQGLERVNLDPAVAAILGVSSGVRTFYRKSLLPIGSAELTRRFQKASLSFNYMRGFNPGNGVYLTSRQETAGVGYTYTGIRKWSLSLTSSYYKINGIGQSTGAYKTVIGGAGATYAVTPVIHVYTRYDARQQQLDASSFNRLAYRVSFGLSFSPGDVPLALW